MEGQELSQPKQKNIRTKRQDSKLVWAGANRFVGKAQTDREKKERKQLEVVAKILDVTPMGVNVLGGQPYINNLGRKDKMKQYLKKATFVYDWIEYSKSDDDKAICQARIAVNNQPIKIDGTEMPWITGECSPKSLKMGTLAGYQNHIAQTRAENRAFEYAFGLRLHQETMARIGEMVKSGNKKDQSDVEVAESAARATVEPSVEEVENDEYETVYENEEGIATEIVEIIETCYNLGAKNKKDVIKMVNDTGNIDIDEVSELNASEAKKVLAKLMTKQNKK